METPLEKVSILVDYIYGVIKVKENDLEPNPMRGRYSIFVKNVAQVEDRLLIVIDIDDSLKNLKMSFAERICDYLFEKRVYQFQNNFYELYKEYKILGEEKFIKKWFDNFLIKSLYKYFSYSYILELSDVYITTKRVVLKSYVNTYWKYCDNPRLFQGKIKESLEFFGLENLSLKELQIKYRKLVKECHPDKALNKKEVHSKMITINYYYQILRSYLGE